MTTATGKPPYRVPGVAESSSSPRNGLAVASLFAGCGGSCLGYLMAGYRVAWANDNDRLCGETYRANFPGHAFDDRSIVDVSPEELMAGAGVAEGELDVLDASPPCQPFSMAGKRQLTDPRASMFGEFARILKGVRPRAFVAENVAGMSRGKMIGYFHEVLEMLRGAGYVVECRKVDAKWLGVPQTRKRLFFVGAREDLGVGPEFPTPDQWHYTIADACPWLRGRAVRIRKKNSAGVIDRQSRMDLDAPAPCVKANGIGSAWLGECKVDGRTNNFLRTGEKVSVDRPSPAVMAHGIGGVAKHQMLVEDGPSIAGTAIGPEAARLRPGESSSKYFSLVRPDPGMPTPTVTAAGGGRGTAGVVAPDGKRKFSIFELRRLCGFPDDFGLAGSFARQWRQLGNAVPPPMMARVAGALAAGTLGAAAGGEPDG